jgi:hypothetical protein
MFCYTENSAMQSPTYSTSATPNTEIDVFSLKPGTRNMSIYNLRAVGRGAALTSLSGISLNVKLWTTASTGGAQLVPSPNDKDSPAAKAVPRIGSGGGVTAVTPGTGGGTYRGGFGFSGSGPGGWVAATPDASLTLGGNDAGSYDLYSISGNPSMNYEFWAEHSE